MTIKITSDSTCDLTAALLAAYDIEIFPLGIAKGGEMFSDGVDIFPDDIYAHVEAGGELCSTSAVNPADYQKRFSELLKQYDAVVHINIGSQFSCCHQNALLAAAELDNVFVVDSANLSTGHGHVVLAAAELAAAGLPAGEIAARLADLAPRVEASFILDRLDYMKKGGRCSAVAVLGANMLKLKPCIEVKDGKMGVGKKYHGSFEKCVRDYVRDRLAGRDDLVGERIFITHSGVAPQVIEITRGAIKECAAFREISVTRAGCTISSHCGPNTLGVLFIRNK